MSAAGVFTTDDHALLVEAFLTESSEILSSIETLLLQLESAPNDHELLNEIFRGAHTLKGGAACLQFDELTAFAHGVEERLEKLRDGETRVTAEVISQLLADVDVLRTLASAAAPRAKTARAETLRVSVAKLDRMLNLTGEIAIARGHVRQLTSADERVLDALRELDRLSIDLQDLVMNARLVPLGPALEPMQRVVRDLAASLEKDAVLVIETNDVEVDMTVIQHMKDPLTHMLRNAVDHGIESPEARMALGKDPGGSIRISAVRESGAIVIRISDDGAGIDADLLDRIFEPGFTTTTEVTDVSGRGVGMDVVRRNVEALRGTIDVESVRGHGTTITIRLPLTLTVIEGFAVGAAGETYVLPIEAVVECTTLPGDAASDVCGVLNIRGDVVPFVRLRGLFKAGESTTSRENVVVVQQGESRAGIVVDELHGSWETVMKPLGGLLRGAPGIAGSSILGDGRVALVLDVREVIRLASENQLTVGSWQSAAAISSSLIRTNTPSVFNPPTPSPHNSTAANR